LAFSASWGFLVQTAGENRLNDGEMEFRRDLTVFCKAAFSHFVAESPRLRNGLRCCNRRRQGLTSRYLLFLSGDISTNSGPNTLVQFVPVM